MSFVHLHGNWVTEMEHNCFSFTSPPLPQLLTNAWPLQTWMTPQSTGPNPSQISSTASDPLSVSVQTQTHGASGWFYLPAAHPEQRNNLSAQGGPALNTNPPPLPQPGNHWRCSGAEGWDCDTHSKLWRRFKFGHWSRGRTVKCLNAIYNFNWMYLTICKPKVLHFMPSYQHFNSC